MLNANIRRDKELVPVLATLTMKAKLGNHVGAFKTVMRAMAALLVDLVIPLADLTVAFLDLVIPFLVAACRVHVVELLVAPLAVTLSGPDNLIWD
jgi:hypothetical protein